MAAVWICLVPAISCVSRYNHFRRPTCTSSLLILRPPYERKIDKAGTRWATQGPDTPLVSSSYQRKVPQAAQVDVMAGKEIRRAFAEHAHGDHRAKCCGGQCPAMKVLCGLASVLVSPPISRRHYDSGNLQGLGSIAGNIPKGSV